MKKVFLLSALAVFSFAACANTANTVDPSSLYKAKITQRQMYQYIGPDPYRQVYLVDGSIADVPVAASNTPTYVYRRYDSHNHVVMEEEYKSASFRYMNNSYIKKMQTTITSYTNKYDGRGNLIYRFIVKEENYRSYYRKSTAYIEKYEYDNQNRLIKAEYLGNGASRIPIYGSRDIIGSAYIDIPYAVSTEEYTYEGNSRTYKTYSLTEEIFEDTPVMREEGEEVDSLIRTLNIIRDFKNNDIIKETAIYTTETEQGGGILPDNYDGEMQTYKTEVTYVSNYTYDDYHCMVGAETYATRSFGGSTIYSNVLAMEMTASYYKHNPNKIDRCTIMSYSEAVEDEPVIFIGDSYSKFVNEATVTYRSCNYDSEGRLTIDTLVALDGEFSEDGDFYPHAGIEEISLYAY